MWQQIFLGFTGLCAGVIISGGLAGLMIGLSIIPRYAGITHTADCILLYEDAALLGTIAGVLTYLYRLPLPIGQGGLAVFGIFSGIFLGGWILALAEMADVFPVFCRRIRFLKGLPLVIVSIALGKSIGSLLFYFLGWQ
ncbi:MAG TPA: stage V sporulation protein AB [Candidatus Blautia faecigallinarum]|uniref:Stage V sporulation protein AB n=1 Tax=Candidatus Blautia faecigallinarum TaxID=2838488 RepID=A0A9D2DRT3_9FIRM|nr:stage V sporulation protein AB [Candidatus Blautia faecigallinarum]